MRVCIVCAPRRRCKCTISPKRISGWSWWDFATLGMRMLFPISLWCRSPIQTINVPSERKTRENTEYNEYKGDDVHDKVFQQVLKQSYLMFRLFTGTFRSHFNGEDDEARKIEHFKTILEQFYSKVWLSNDITFSNTFSFSYDHSLNILFCSTWKQWNYATVIF